MPLLVKTHRQMTVRRGQRENSERVALLLTRRIVSCELERDVKVIDQLY